MILYGKKDLMGNWEFTSHEPKDWSHSIRTEGFPEPRICEHEHADRYHQQNYYKCVKCGIFLKAPKWEPL